MKYVLEISINTDGDFTFPFVPRGMEYYSDCSYNFSKTYNDINKAKEDVKTICTFLRGNMGTDRDYVREQFYGCVDEFISKVDSYGGSSKNEVVASYMSGNYDGTVFEFYSEEQWVDCGFHVSEEEYQMIKGSKNVTQEIIKEAVLNLFRGSE